MSDIRQDGPKMRENVVHINFTRGMKDGEQERSHTARFMLGGDEPVTGYCWPGREFVLSDADASVCVERGYFFPLSFLTIFYKNRALTLLMETDFTRIALKKDKSRIQVDLSYALEVKEAVIRLFRHEPDWHISLALYREWISENVPERMPDNPLFGKFHLKRTFFHERFCSRHIAEKSGELRLEQLWEEAENLAGVDTLLLFDHAYDPETGIRCGNTDPLTGVADKDRLQAELGSLRERGVLSFAYFDPYLLEDDSEWTERIPKEELALRTGDGSIFRQWAQDEWSPSPASELWQEEASDYCRAAVKGLGTDGIYLDEIGNGTQYHCRWGGADQENCLKQRRWELNQTRAEKDLTEACLNTIPESMAMCEFPPTDRLAGQFQAVLNDSRSIVDIYRFAFPKKKVFRMGRCDYPTGDDVFAANSAFFNGEGLWLDNDLLDDAWYPPAIRKRIRDQYLIQKEYKAYFDSGRAVPLAEGTTDEVYVNCFYGPEGRIYTAYNGGKEEKRFFLPVKERETTRVLYTADVTRKVQTADGTEIYVKPGGVCAVLAGIGVQQDNTIV